MSYLELKDIYYKVDNTEILKGISMSIDKGDCVSIVGASGSGKSTLLKICADLIEFSSGEIKYEGKSYLSYNPMNIRKCISYCIQVPYLFGDTVRENLEFPFKIRGDEVNEIKIHELINKFNLEKNIIDKKIDYLSGGEKQRVCIIRNLLYTPKILLLDEATSALDEENAKNIETYIKELNEKGVTVIWITHNNKQSEGIFNKRIIMSKGNIEKVEVIIRE